MYGCQALVQLHRMRMRVGMSRVRPADAATLTSTFAAFEQVPAAQIAGMREVKPAIYGESIQKSTLSLCTARWVLALEVSHLRLPPSFCCSGFSGLLQTSFFANRYLHEVEWEYVELYLPLG